MADIVEPATGVNVNAATEHVAEDVDNHTPETPPLEPPAANIPPPTDANGGLAELRSMVETLATAVNTLTETVTDLLPKDASVHRSTPWTHRGGTRRDNI